MSPASPLGGGVMRPWLVGAIVLGSAVAGTLTVLIVFRMVRPPDATAATLGALWVAMPYLAAAGLAVLRRRHTGALIALLIALLVAGLVGVSLFDSAATQQEIARKQAENAVLPGEDPQHGPAAMRRAGAEMGVAVGGVFSITLAVVLPPLQLAAVAIAAGIGYGVSAWLRRRREGDLDHTDTHGPAG
jgi:hypothetical protein